jgi:hypothetical protein
MPVTGYRTEIRNPLPQVRTLGVAAATYLPMDFVSVQERPRWGMHGVQLPTFGCPVPQGFGEPDELCDYTVTAREPNVDLNDADGCAEFNPFEVYFQLEHKFVQSYTRDELMTYLRAYAQLHRSRIIAREALTGTLTAAGPSLAGEADAVTGVDSSIKGALAAVEDGLAARIGNGVGMIHLSPGLFTLLGGSFDVTDTEIRTKTGHLVVVDAGYVGIAPGGGAPTAGEAWIYGSGPVYLEATPTRYNGQDAEAFELTTNTGVIHFEETAVVAFEPCTVVAAMGSTKS